MLEREGVEEIAGRGMQTFLFSLRSYLWALGLCLLTLAPWPCIGLTAPKQGKKYAATGNITEMEHCGALGCSSYN